MLYTSVMQHNIACQVISHPVRQGYYNLTHCNYTCIAITYKQNRSVSGRACIKPHLWQKFDFENYGVAICSAYVCLQYLFCFF